MQIDLRLIFVLGTAYETHDNYLGNCRGGSTFTRLDSQLANARRGHGDRDGK